jgi:Mg2+ and Co2+ transporter CorA
MLLPMSFIAGLFGMNFFGDTLMFTSPALPKATIFWLACAVMLGTPMGMAFLAWRRVDFEIVLGISLLDFEIIKDIFRKFYG